MVVAGSQRSPEIFSAVLDYAHVQCEGRTGCQARNPVLSSYPRHLSNPKDFIETSVKDDFTFNWEDEVRRAQDHSYAWCTGLSVCPLPKPAMKSKKPAATCVFSTNHYGDIFYQVNIIVKNP